MYVVSGKNYLIGKSQTYLIGHNVSAVEETHTGSHIALEGFSYIRHLLLLIVRIFSKTKIDFFMYIHFHNNRPTKNISS